MTNETLDKKLVQEDMKAIKKDIALGTTGAVLTGALLANAVNYYMQDKIGMSVSQVMIACAPALAIVYPCLSDAYSRTQKYMHNRE